MHLANIHGAKARLSQLIGRALAGEDVQIAGAGQQRGLVTEVAAAMQKGGAADEILG